MLGSEAPQLQSSVFNVQQANSLTVQHCNTTTPSPSTAILVQVLAQGAPMLRALWLPRPVLPPIRHGGWRQQLLLQHSEEVAGGSETFAGSIVVETFFVFLIIFINSFFKFIVVELPWKTGLCASSHKTWWSSTTCCTLSPDFPSRRLWTGLCFLSLSL